MIFTKIIRGFISAELLAWKKYAVKPTKRQVRKLTKFVLSHIKQIQEG
ncbi:DUF7279 family protein [Morganella morganii]